MIPVHQIMTLNAYCAYYIYFPLRGNKNRFRVTKGLYFDVHNIVCYSMTLYPTCHKIPTAFGLQLIEVRTGSVRNIERMCRYQT